VPKRGFTNPFRKEYAEVNLERLEAFEAGTIVTPEVLREHGLVKSFRDGVKILARGKLTKALTVRAHKFSAKAQEEIGKAGGKAEVIEG
jgi:large subunit ribosomal protein L15